MKRPRLTAKASRDLARADAHLAGRYWLTAKAARYLGHPVPAHLPDDQTVVVLHDKESP